MFFAKNTQAKGRQPKGKKCLGAPLQLTAEVDGLQDMSHTHLHTGLLETYSVGAVQTGAGTWDKDLSLLMSLQILPGEQNRGIIVTNENISHVFETFITF